MRPSLVFDIETVPDPDLARALADAEGLSDKAALARVAPPRDDTEPYRFPKPLYHRVVAISVAVVNGGGGVERLKPLGGAGGDERGLLEEFWEGIRAHDGIRLITFNGRTFDLPVLVQRSLFLGLSPGPLLQKAYRYRYGDDHLDLCDFLSNYRASEPLKQDEMALMLGVPGKIGLDGGMFCASGRRAATTRSGRTAPATWRR